jgi:superfamily II DNA or RNA helicase/predicted transcriptional regulator
MANTKDSILKLEDYQENAYNEVEALFDAGKYAAVVLPTGTGKSFVTLKYLQEHPDKKVLFLSPRLAINLQMYEYVVRQIGGRQDSTEDIYKEFDSMGNAAKSFIPGIETLSYQAIMRMADKGKLDETIEKIKPDLIVLDEVHHVKTKRVREQYIIDEEDEVELKRDDNIWGKTVKQLTDKCPNAKVLGLSATPIRTDGANVVERLFENSIAYEMSLLEAMEEGIIHPPKYVVPDFVKEDELETLLEKIDKADDQRKLELKELYDQLSEMSSKAPGIPEVMGEHIKEKNGKYIVFCKDIKDMNEKMSQAKEWFERVDSDPTIYRVSSEQGDNKKQLDAFNNDNSDKLKLMYCVGMISEGVHLNDVSGVVLTTKTGSQIDFLQKIGRTITISNEKRETLVIDLANSNEVLSKEFNDKKYEISDLDALQELVSWIEKHDGRLPKHEGYKTNKEKVMFFRMMRLNNKYFKYAEDPNLLDTLDEDEREEYEKIISLGESIDLFAEYIKVANEEKAQEADEALNRFLESIKIKGVRKEFLKILQESTIKENVYEKIIEWLETHDGKMPQSNFKVEGKTKRTNQLTEEERVERNLYARWKNSKEFKILKEYAGKDILWVPEEYRERIDKLRSYGLGLRKSGYEGIIEWLKTHDGKMPKKRNSKEETNVYQRWIISDEYKILKEYVGRDISEVPKECREKISMLRNYGLGLETKSAYEEIIEWLETHNGKMPMKRESKEKINLYARWIISDEYKMLKEYVGRDISEVPKEYREKISMLRNYGLGLETKNPYEEIIEWLEVHGGKMPQSTFKENGKVRKGEELTEEEKEEKRLYARWIKSDEYKMLNEYVGRDASEVPEEYREKISTLRNYGLGLEIKNPYEEIIEWLEAHGGNMPQSGNKENGKYKKIGELTEEEREERNLYRRWIKSDEYKMLNEYVGRDISEVPEEYREKISKLRNYELGLETKNTYEEIIEWLEVHGGNMPKSRFKENGKEKKAEELTEEERKEKNLYRRWSGSDEYKVLKAYVGKDISEVTEEYREKISTLRNYGLGITAYEEIIEWLKAHGGKMPQSKFRKNGKQKKAEELTEEEKVQKNLYDRWKNSKEFKILKEYAGKDILWVPEEYRERIDKLRSYGLGLEPKTKKEKLKEAIEDRDNAKDLNIEARKLEQEVSRALDRKNKKDLVE